MVKAKKLVFKWSLLVFSFFTLSLFLVSCTENVREIKSSSVINELFPNFWVFITHLLAFFILLTLMIFLFWKPTQRFLNNRKNLLEAQIKQANELEKQARNLLEESNQRHEKALIVSKEIVDQANYEALQLKSEIEKTANRQANLMIFQARQEIEKERRSLKEQSIKESVELAMLAAQELILKKIDQKSDREFIDKFIRDLEANETEDD
ncbi:F0F1 ATP synthase subunit B [Mycoplasmoides genitalium]|uniref:ATP synthase subunit b n=1 Tax=Mycoplasma genitalium (strain ATCC 33530 / DSM 19775 / NCTC 10195 / G37) TaxID=243273 RepID=ATPF_MYCGE|nr:F0F1 ATP synthase subunit B [Mycoplasmoides genitalium]P47643.1 RecName: Full=ATP synthase subunit b; AltName: Full=ATP synthase F(0) sector subunit b; AltName: Full=ATPase subunit I; AltName: Full=F-type ATPase subunit b; Short=F-ATPase subunit b; Flags: Precursor [Mycoplasmoides genitalium G37]AAC71631.1 ATP synthase F0, B subunit [Mycoplasmoides genitalium G37]ABY79481.1 ATP synthase F0, B subunit [synthetic Mycoplasma genitalium JCVI-1.0]AFQ03246.1 F0F1 ATP synthase subunit B [Mycoplasmo